MGSKFVRSSAGPLKPGSYYRVKIGQLERAVAAAETVAAGSGRAAEVAASRLSVTLRPKLAYYRERLESVKRAEVAALGAAACRAGASLDACVFHGPGDVQARLFCAWCNGWWDERLPIKKG
jgi:hypothetical protein